MMSLGLAIRNGYLTEERLRKLGIDPNSEAPTFPEDADIIQANAQMNAIMGTILKGVTFSKEEEALIQEAIRDVLETPLIESVAKDEVIEIEVD